jgi:hypothetical protein
LTGKSFAQELPPHTNNYAKMVEKCIETVVEEIPTSKILGKEAIA